MDDFGALLVLGFVLWSVLGGLLGRSRQGTRPPAGGQSRPRQQPRVESPRPRGTTSSETTAATAAPATSASDMIPGELWEILTGEKRRPAPVSEPRAEAPGPVRSGDYEPDFEPEQPEEGWRPGRVAVPGPEPLDVARPGRSAESLEAEPVIVSLETPPPPPAARRAAFHQRIDRSAPQAGPRRRRRLPLSLDGMADLRRMVVLREVLGPPKALE